LTGGVWVVCFEPNHVNERKVKINGSKNCEFRSLGIDAEIMNATRVRFAKQSIQSLDWDLNDRCIRLQISCLTRDSVEMPHIIVLLEAREHARVPRDRDELSLSIPVSNCDIDVRAGRAVCDELRKQIRVRLDIQPRPPPFPLKEEGIIKDNSVPRANINKDTSLESFEDVRLKKLILILLAVEHWIDPDAVS
jgi:hypothetical protein